MLDGIICDQQGRIKEISDSYAELLRCNQADIVNSKRFFFFFAKTTVLTIIKQWTTSLVKKNSLQLTTILRRADDSIFPAIITIVKQSSDNNSINYLINIIPQEKFIASLHITTPPLLENINKWLLIIRANFLVAILMPLVFSIIWSLQYTTINNVNVSIIIATIFGAILSHIAANTFNDYFDWLNGTDKVNNDYIMSISGGSRAIDFGLISEQKLLAVALASFLMAACCALYIAIIRGPIVIIFIAIGAFAVYFYTAPPIRLSARYGLGELFTFLCFGPLVTAGVIYVVTNIYSWENFIIGVPMGLLITSCLLMNEYPDLKADAISKKINLAVCLGPKLLPWAVILLILLAYITTLIAIFAKILPNVFLLTMVSIPLAIYEIITIAKINQNYNLIYNACINNLKLHAFFSMTFIFSALVELLHIAKTHQLILVD